MIGKRIVEQLEIENKTKLQHGQKRVVAANVLIDVASAINSSRPYQLFSSHC